MRSYSDSSSGSREVRVAFIPSFSVGDLSFSFSLDPQQLDPAFRPGDMSLPFWLSYGFSFLESLNWVSPSGRSAVAFDKTSYLHGDPTGLFPGHNHYWDGVHERLSFDSTVTAGPYSHRLFFSDLSFSEWADKDAGFLSGLLFDFDFRHIAFGTGMLSDIGYGETAPTSLFPELWLSIPFVKGRVGFSLDIGAVMAIDDVTKASPEDFRNWGAYLALPLKSGDFNMRLGAMWQSGSVYFARYNEYYTPTLTDQQTVAVYLSTLYRDRNVDLKLDYLMNIDPFTPRIIPENTFSDFAVGFSMGAIDAIVGVRKQNVFSLDDFIETSDIYFGMETQTGSLTSRLIFRFMNGYPQLGFSSSLALVDLDNVGKEEKKESLVDLRFDLGFRAIHDEDIEFTLTPLLEIGRDDFQLTLRVPLDLSVGMDSVVLEPPKGDTWWDLWQDTSSLTSIYDSVTDMFVFIDSMKLGADDDMFYAELSRTKPMNDVFFENYRSQDALSLNLGINFANLALTLWIDDMEAPRIMNPMLAWYPLNDESATFIVSAPTEVLMKDFMNYEIKSFFGLSFMYPFLENRLKLSVFSYGEIYALYEDGIPVSTKIIYDFDKNRFGSYMLGGEVSWTDRMFHAGFAGGINNGNLYPNYWNSFTSLNPDRNKSNAVGETFSIWMIAEAGLKFDSVDLFMKYMLPDMAGLWADERESEGDMLTFALRFTLPNGVGMAMKLSRLDLISTMDEIRDIKEYILSDRTIYAFSLIKEFDSMSLEAELSAQAYYGESREGYVNSYSLIRFAPGVRIKTRIGF